MKKQVIMALLLGLVLPLGMLAAHIPKETAQTEPTALQTEAAPVMIEVLGEDGGKQMELETYILGVVLAEMPGEFQEEALKAQAVVARTYAMKRMEQGSKHDTAAVCTQAACCQGYRAAEDYLTEGGNQQTVDKVTDAVQATASMVLTYGGTLIDATYFSCSGGSTEAAVAVWGADVPYLQAVESPGEEIAAHYTDQVVLSAEEFAARTGCTGDPGSWFGAVTYTEGGGVETMELCGKTFTGTQLRTLLDLRSTDFTVTVLGNQVVIDTKGFGHRVGMSQYGAEAMAREGHSFDEILAHYYVGTMLEEVG